MRNMSHLQIAIPTSINKGVWGGIMLHAGITGCGLFSQDAFPIIPTPLPMKSPQPLVPVVTLGYLKSLQTNSWQMRWNSTFMKIWTWNRVYHEISMNTKWEGETCFDCYDTIPWRWQQRSTSLTFGEEAGGRPCLLTCTYLHLIPCPPLSQADGRCCQRAYHDSFKPSSALRCLHPSSPTLTPFNPDSSPVPGRCMQASACQGSCCSPLVGTQACALKLSPPPTTASAGGYLSRRSPNWPLPVVWSWLLLDDISFPLHLSIFELRFAKRSGKICGFVTLKH